MELKETTEFHPKMLKQWTFGDFSLTSESQFQ